MIYPYKNRTASEKMMYTCVIIINIWTDKPGKQHLKFGISVQEVSIYIKMFIIIGKKGRVQAKMVKIETIIKYATFMCYTNRNLGGDNIYQIETHKIRRQ